MTTTSTALTAAPQRTTLEPTSAELTSAEPLALLHARHRQARDQVEARVDAGELDAKRASTLIGAAVGLHSRLSPGAIREIAARASRLLPYYDTLWQAPDSAFAFTWRGIEHLDAALARGRGAILVTAHFGPYRWLAPELLARGVPLTMLVDEAFQRVLDHDVSSRVHKIYSQFSREQFQTVSSGSPQTLWHMARALKQGRVVITFADGNSGIEGKAGASGCVELPFLGQTIRSRPGIAALGHVSAAPLLPIVATRAGVEGVFEIQEAIVPNVDENAQSFRQRGTVSLFAWLEQLVLRAPADWEEWWLLPNWLAGKMTVSCTRTPRPDFRLTLPGLTRAQLGLGDNALFRVDDGERRYVLDLAHGSSESEQRLYSLLLASERGEAARAWLDVQSDESTARALLEREVQRGRVVLTRPRPLREEQ